MVSHAVNLALCLVFNVRRPFAKGGLDRVLKDRPQDHRYRKMDGRAEAHLIVMACSAVPHGHDHWNLCL